MLGYSLGGRTALSFAQYFPNQVKSLILESASPGLKTEAERKTRREQDDKLAEKIKEEGIEAFVNKWENIPLFTSQKNLPKTIQNRIRKERLSQKKTGLGNSLVYMGTGRQPSWWDQLQSLTIPVLLIVGELDVKFVQINQTMHHLLKHSTIQCVPNAGHAVHIEQVEKFDKIIGDFLSH